MSQLITAAELAGLTEQQLRALYQRIISDLSRRGQRAEDCPDILASLRNIEAAIGRLKRSPFKPPGF